MLGKLLIIRKNGRTVQTYGLNQLEKYNMKYIFPCIVIFISCSVCASGDLEIYPGLKFDLTENQRLENPEETSTFQRWPWEHIPIDDYGNNNRKTTSIDLAADLGLPTERRLNTFEEFIERNRNDLNKKTVDLFNFLRTRTNNDKRIEDQWPPRSGGPYHKYPVLDDVRPYPPQQEDDFSFHEDDLADLNFGFENSFGKPLKEVRIENELDDGDGYQEKDGMDGHYGHKVDFESEKQSEEASGKGALDNIKFVEDPTEFAYPPSDARFFRTADNDNKSSARSEDNTKLSNILLNQRSGDKFIENIDSLNNLTDDDEIETNQETSNGEVVVVRHQQNADSAGMYIIAVVAGISAAATVGLIAVGIGWYNLQKHVKNASDVEYPAYGVTGPNKDISPSGDRRLAQSAQMYHYQHQKQQIIAMESRAAAGDRHGSVSEADSDEENEEGDYTVYECPGLAPTGEMEVKNPLFQDDPTPAQTPPVKASEEEKK